MNPDEVAKVCDELHECVDQTLEESPTVFAKALSTVRTMRAAASWDNPITVLTEIEQQPTPWFSLDKWRDLPVRGKRRFARSFGFPAYAIKRRGRKLCLMATPVSPPETQLRRVARDRIAKGHLPPRVSGDIWRGAGTGRPCALCDRPISRDEPEIEIEQSVDEEVEALGFHVTCELLWQLECVRAAHMKQYPKA
jgi:hypothetical protein